MKPRLNQKYLQKKQVRPLREYCSSCGVTSNPLPPSCEQSRWHPPTVCPATNISHSGFNWGCLYNQLLVHINNTRYNRLVPELPRGTAQAVKTKPSSCSTATIEFLSSCPISCFPPLLPGTCKATFGTDRDKKFTGLRLFLLKAFTFSCWKEN